MNDSGKRPVPPPSAWGCLSTTARPISRSPSARCSRKRFDDLELIICDNASTDRTAEICQDYAARDRRVRYFRNPQNLGAAPNYNLAFSHARGRYFKWLAHDDRITPSYLAKTVRVLDERTDAVLCNSVVQYIDQNGAPIGFYNSGLALADSQSAAARFGWMVLRSHSCVDFFGLIRREALQDSLLHGSFHGADRALLAQLAIRGRLIQLPAPLVEMREHPNRYTRSNVRSADRAAWHDASKRGKISLPTWRLYAEYLKMVRKERMLPNERAGCYLRSGAMVVRQLEHRAGGGRRGRGCCAGSAGRG